MVKHECGLCIRDNQHCKIYKSLWDLLTGNVKDCVIFQDYHKGLERESNKKKWKDDKR